MRLKWLFKLMTPDQRASIDNTIRSLRHDLKSPWMRLLFFGALLCSIGWGVIDLYTLATTGMFDLKGVGWVQCRAKFDICIWHTFAMSGMVVVTTAIAVFAAFYLSRFSVEEK